MSAGRSVPPLVFFFLNVPSGLSTGFVTSVLPFVLTRAGLPVATAATVTAAGLVPATWRVLGGPLVDLTLDLRTWQVLTVIATALTILPIAFVPVTAGGVPLLTALVTLSAVASNLSVVPAGG